MYINIIINIFSQHDRPRFSDWKDVKFESKFGQVYSNWVAGMSDNSTNRSKAPQTDEVGIRAEGERKYIALICFQNVHVSSGVPSYSILILDIR